MNHSKIFLFVLLLPHLLALQVAGQPAPAPNICLQIEGKVTNAGQDGSKCKVEVFLDDRAVDSVVLAGNRHKFKLNLEKDQHYTVLISKPGFVSKSICVHTHIEGHEDELFRFFFETLLVYERAVSEEKPPVATIYFNKRKNCFYYTRNVNADDLCKKAVSSARN